jgi:5-formyltetrahydrofolate cyclo-ligase
MTNESDPDGLDAAKIACRSEMRRRLDEFGEEDRRIASARLVDRLVASDLWLQAERIAMFVPIGREPDLRSAIATARSSGRAVLLPRSRTEPVGIELVPLGDSDPTTLPRDPLGVPSPTGPAVDPDGGSAPDLVVVPGVAFDEIGGRLGRGGGFYDRLLEHLRRTAAPPTVIGACFACQQVVEVPRAPHDQVVDFICTERSLDGPLPPRTVRRRS